MKKAMLYITLFFCLFLTPLMVRAKESNNNFSESQYITCIYNVNHYEIKFNVKATGKGGATFSRDEKKVDVNNRTNYVFTDGDNAIAANNFIKDEKLVCPSTLYLKYSPGANTNVGVKLSFTSFSDSKASTSLASSTDNKMPFIISNNSSGKACSYNGTLVQGSGTVPITITRENDNLKIEISNGYQEGKNDLLISDFPIDKNGICPLIYIKCGSDANNKFCHFYKDATAIDEMHSDEGQSPDKETIKEELGNSNNNSTNVINMSICQQDGVQKALKFIGILLLVAKILVPIILIVFGVMDYAKAMIASDADAISKATKSLVFRVVAGVIIFILPTIVNFVFSTVVKNKANFNQCRACIFERKC